MAVVFPGSPDRRDFLRGSAYLTGGAFLAACGGISAESAQNAGASEGVSAARRPRRRAVTC